MLSSAECAETVFEQLLLSAWVLESISQTSAASSESAFTAWYPFSH